jgi:DNA-binding transcriptional ArsR family regulator
LTVTVEQLIFNSVVEHKNPRLNDTYQALADPTRRAILARLVQGEVRVSDLAEPFEMSLNAVSKHIRLLERAGLVQREVRGREHYLTVDPTPLREAADWLNTYQQFWRQRLDRLEAFLRQQKETQRGRRTV